MSDRKKTGGRTKGVPNKATAEIKELAKEYGPAAIKKLAEMGGLVKDVSAAAAEAVQRAALSDLLERGYGKPSQPLEHTGSAVEALLERLAGA